MGKEYTLLIFAILLGAVMLAESLSGYFQPTGQGSVTVVLSKQDGEISDLNTPRRVIEQRVYRINKVAFPEGETLRHKDLGALPFNQNCYLDMTGEFKVLNDGEYEFRITSDDGFRFYIDDTLKLESPGPRRFETSNVDLLLSAGNHRFKIEYFQQAGQAGLEATYRQKGGKERYFFIGENSRFVNFF